MCHLTKDAQTFAYICANVQESFKVMAALTLKYIANVSVMNMIWTNIPGWKAAMGLIILHSTHQPTNVSPHAGNYKGIIVLHSR